MIPQLLLQKFRSHLVTGCIFKIIRRNSVIMKISLLIRPLHSHTHTLSVCCVRPPRSLTVFYPFFETPHRWSACVEDVKRLQIFYMIKSLSSWREELQGKPISHSFLMILLRWNSLCSLFTALHMKMGKQNNLYNKVILIDVMKAQTNPVVKLF